MEQARQFVFGSNPRLYEHPVVDICDHVSRRSADHLRLADVIGERSSLPTSPCKDRRQSSRQTGNKLPRSDRPALTLRRWWRGVRDSHQIFSRRVGHHFFPVIIKFGGRTISRHDHPQLVRPLESDLGLGRECQGMTLTARTLVKMHRIEFHCPRRGEPAARSFKNVECLWLKRRRGFGRGACLGRGRFGLLFVAGLPCAFGRVRTTPNASSSAHQTT